MPTTACFCRNAPSTLLYGVYQGLTSYFPFQQWICSYSLPVSDTFCFLGTAVFAAWGGTFLFKPKA
ncbi:hypothetical protein A3860_12690 [Niastella vici]|uniref:Uncharacterized protein n=1 Tax=Niastella vici TaxID=1703345 RepID=A0A1V9G723_9BACT|nr:hypothetical protein A3860_12690 [Niastella vici]